MTFDPTTRHQPCRDADDAILTRQSIRAFLPDKPVSRATVEDILRLAARAPSGTNIQPWKVHVLAGAPKAELTRRILAAFDDPEQAKRHTREYAYYPEKWVSPYVDRRRKIGWDMYGLLGIGKGDFEKTHAQHGRNYAFFDAPVGLMITMARVMERGSLIDCGMFLENLMIAARARGLDTCPQAAFLEYHRIIAEVVGIPDDEMLVCGMSLGYADPAAKINTLVTEREPVEGFATFRGF
jgi:nitroreductase